MYSKVVEVEVDVEVVVVDVVSKEVVVGFMVVCIITGFFFAVVEVADSKIVVVGSCSSSLKPGMLMHPAKRTIKTIHDRMVSI